MVKPRPAPRARWVPVVAQTDWIDSSRRRCDREGRPQQLLGRLDEVATECKAGGLPAAKPQLGHNLHGKCTAVVLESPAVASCPPQVVPVVGTEVAAGIGIAVPTDHGLSTDGRTVTDIGLVDRQCRSFLPGLERDHELISSEHKALMVAGRLVGSIRQCCVVRMPAIAYLRAFCRSIERL